MASIPNWSEINRQAIEHWPFVSPLLARPETEEQYDLLVSYLDELLEIVGNDEAHPLTTLITQVAEAIAAYDHLHRPMPVAPGHEVLRLLMEAHRLKQGDLPEVGCQSVLSEILSGKRKLNVRQIGTLATRFKVPADVFFG